MKKIYTALAALAVTLTASALQPGHGRQAAKQPATIGNFAATTRLNCVTESNNLRGKQAAVAQSRKEAMKVHSRRELTEDDVIWEPEGEVSHYVNNATGFSDSFFGITYDMATFPASVAIDENDDVYISGFISQVESDLWIKGHMADGKVTVELPQIAYFDFDEDGMEVFFYAMVCELYDFEQDGQAYKGYKNCDESKQTLTYLVGDDMSLTLQLNDGNAEDITTIPPYIIALVSDTTPGENAWTGFGDAYQTFAPFTDVATELPDDVELEQWVFMSNQKNGLAKVGFKDDKVYIADFWDANPDVVAVGTVEGDKVVIAPQYAGETYGYLTYIMGIEWLDEDFIDYEILDRYELDYDAEAKVIATNNPMIDFVFNTNSTSYSPFDYYENVTFKLQNPEDMLAAPMDPEVTYFEPVHYQDFLGYDEGYIEWDIPAVNVNGFMLLTENMYYNIYFNGELYTFTVEEYPGFDEDMTDIPYDYEDGWDLQVIESDHYLSFRNPDFTTFGCQSFFLADNGELFASNLVTFEDTGVASASVDAKKVVAVEFYNLQGQRIANPAHGLFIQVQRLADGSTRALKIAK